MGWLDKPLFGAAMTFDCGPADARGNFAVRRARLHVADKAFAVAAPRAWNALPSDIKHTSSRISFRNKLKTRFLKL